MVIWVGRRLERSFLQADDVQSHLTTTRLLAFTWLVSVCGVYMFSLWMCGFYACIRFICDCPAILSRQSEGVSKSPLWLFQWEAEWRWALRRPVWSCKATKHHVWLGHCSFSIDICAHKQGTELQLNLEATGHDWRFFLTDKHQVWCWSHLNARWKHHGRMLNHYCTIMNNIGIISLVVAMFFFVPLKLLSCPGSGISWCHKTFHPLKKSN